MTTPTQIAAAFEAACRDELAAPKPGNVHLFADGHRMTADEFIRSAAAAAVPLAQPGARVGARILGAIEATAAAVGTNTNLGIVLLCAPLAAAAERAHSDLRDMLGGILQDLDTQDAELAFRAIVKAAPAGLGRASRHDVFEPPAVSLKEAMAEAAERDRIARQYVTRFDDIFELGEATLVNARTRAEEPQWATLRVYLAFLSAFPDSHIVRKHGPAVAEEVRRDAKTLQARLAGETRSSAMLGDILQWDTLLKQRNINPGTSADLTVATLFADRLAHVPAKWQPVRR